ncbi:MAG TPA: hypothetical protein VHV77_18290 [Pirellulales bacterium]|nr:hypothetical protein [Pirellulales bacterium]
MDIGENVVTSSLSEASSVHCWIVVSEDDPFRTILISHRPGLRIGSSSARACDVASNAGKPNAIQIQSGHRVMLRFP